MHPCRIAVGSKAGWQPGTFRSSRDSREAVQQSVEQYLDEDELEELRRTNLQVAAVCVLVWVGGGVGGMWTGRG